MIEETKHKRELEKRGGRNQWRLKKGRSLKFMVGG